MSCCDDFGNCDQGRDCPVRQPAKVATARPLYRRCDVMGVCQSPDAECQANCRLHDAVTDPHIATGAVLTDETAHIGLQFVGTVLVVTAVMATAAFVFGLYIERIAAALMAAAEVVTRLVVQVAGAL
jgi:hypothetical protein